MTPKPTNLFWVDNDYMSVLNPLSMRLERDGFSLTKAATYEEAIRYISSRDFDDIDSLLLDVIIPSATKCMSFAGLSVATEIVRKQKICPMAFLSVVPRDEVSTLIDDLDSKRSMSKIKYFDKSKLLDPNHFESLVSFLRGGGL